MSVKQELIELCEVQVAFWEKFKKETESIPEGEAISVILKWNSFFKENVEAIDKLSKTRKYIRNIEENLIMKQLCSKTDI